MNSDSASQLLAIYLRNSRRILRANFGIREVESTFFDIIGLLRDHEELKGEMLRAIRNTMVSVEPGSLADDMVPTELIELLAHELHWVELKAISSERVQCRLGGDWRLASGDISTRVLEAFSDSWADREFYARYGRSALK